MTSLESAHAGPEAGISLQNVADTRHSPAARLLLLSICLVFVLAIGWISFAKVDQVVSAPGIVRPAGRVKMINHSDGGTVKALLVKSGDLVAPGQPLVKLDGDLLAAEIAQHRAQLDEAHAEVARLEAESTGATLSFSPELATRRPDLVERERELYSAHRQALDARRAEADSTVAQRGAEAASIAERIAQLKRSVEILRQQDTSVSELAAKGYFPKLQHLTLKRDLVAAEGELAQAVEAKNVAESMRNGAVDHRRGIDREFESDVLARLSTAKSNEQKVATDLQQLVARSDRLTVASPVRGIVQNLAVTSPGQSIAPNQPMMEIVPVGDSLVVQADVANDDIGSVEAGQPATVKVRTFDFLKYGSLSGKIERVAADATKDGETGGLHFLVEVRTNGTELSDQTRRVSIIPGMLVDVDFKVGRRSIMSYLTDRIFKTTAAAFSEK
jgi:adhesin transport system membrane fusion protein